MAAGKGERSSEGDLSVTALYTSQVARWGRLPYAELYDLPAARAVFRVTNLFLGVARLLRRLPSLRHSVLQRQVLIDRLLAREGARRVLELACGLSRRGVALTDDPAVEVVEADLPHVVEAKRGLLERSEAGREALARPNLRIVQADATVQDLGAIAPAGPGLYVVAEGLLMYLDAAAQEDFWRRCHDLLRARGGGALVFDLVPSVEEPPPGLVGRVLGWLMARFTGGRTFERDTRTRDDLAQALRDVGFDPVELLEPPRLAREWGLPHPERRTQQLVFVCRVAPA